MKANIPWWYQLIVDKINTAGMIIQHGLVNKHVNRLRIPYHPYGSIDHLKRVNLSRDTSISHSPILVYSVLTHLYFIKNAVSAALQNSKKWNFPVLH